jgi:hypothetical protein
MICGIYGNISIIFSMRRPAVACLSAVLISVIGRMIRGDIVEMAIAMRQKYKERCFQ